MQMPRMCIPDWAAENTARAEEREMQQTQAQQNFCTRMKQTDSTGHNGSGKLHIVFQHLQGQQGM